MSYKTKVGSDGTRRMIDTVSGRSANVLYPGNSVSGGRMKILTAASTLTHNDNGSIFFLNSATEFVTTLPAPFLGAEFTFIVKAAPSGASYTVVSSSSANIIKGMVNPAAAAAGDTGTTDDTITFVDSQAVAGDMVMLFSDGTSWFAQAFSRVAAGITFTTAS
jgi:hypothetical protein